MHAYCLISAVGRSRSRARAPRELDQPPTLKTRRSNAVQTRRLALQVTLLERHLAAMETERVRAVRQLHEELNHLHVPRRTPVISPRHARIVGDIENKRAAGRDVRLPKLTSPKRQSQDWLNQTETSHSAQQPVETSESRFPANQNAVAYDDHPGISDDPVQSQEQLDAKLSAPDNGQGDLQTLSTTPLIPTSSSRDAWRVTTQVSAGKKGSVHLRGLSSNSTDVPYTLGLPFKRGSIRRGSKSLPPSGHGHGQVQDQVQGQGRGQQFCDGAVGKLGEPQERNAQSSQHADLQQNEVPNNQSTAVAVPKRPERPDSVPPKNAEPVPDADAQKSVCSSHADNLVTVSMPSVIPAEARQPSKLADKRSRATGETHDVCPLEETPRECGHFPCVQPDTYHSLGFHPDPSPQSWRGWIVQNACRPHHRLAPGRPALAHPEGRRTPADAPGYVKRKRLGKEEVVRLDMARKKHMHALARPPSWNTNYGQPVPYKRLKYPVRLRPLM